MLQRLLIVIGTLMALALSPMNAEAQCAFTGIQSVNGNNGTLGAYSPVGQPQPATLTMTVTFNVQGSGTCSGLLAFQSPTVPARLTRGAGSLQYDIQTLAGTSLLYVSQPTATLPVSASVAGGQTTAQVQIQVRAIALAGQITPSGAFNGNDVTLQMLTIPGAQIGTQISSQRVSTIRTGSLPANTATSVTRR